MIIDSISVVALDTSFVSTILPETRTEDVEESHSHWKQWKMYSHLSGIGGRNRDKYIGLSVIR